MNAQEKRYLKVLMVAVISFFMMACSAKAPKDSPVALNGALQVKGIQLCNEKGEALMLRGVSFG